MSEKFDYAAAVGRSLEGAFKEGFGRVLGDVLAGHVADCPACRKRVADTLGCVLEAKARSK